MCTRSRCSAPGSGNADSSSRRRLPVASPIQRARKPASPARERGLDLLDPPPVLGERRGERLPVLEEDVDPDPRVRTGDPRHVAERSPGGGERVVPLEPGRARLVEQDVRERVGQVARHGDELVVCVGIDRDRARTDRRHERVHLPVVRRVGACGRCQEPGCAVEQIRRRARRPARLGATDRVTADEARIAGRSRADRALRRADVRHRAVVGGTREHRGDDTRQRGHRHGDDRERGAVERLRDRRCGLDRLRSAGDGERLRVAVPAGHALDPRAARGEPGGGSDQTGADDGERHSARINSAIRKAQSSAWRALRRGSHNVS